MSRAISLQLAQAIDELEVGRIVDAGLGVSWDSDPYLLAAAGADGYFMEQATMFTWEAAVAGCLMAYAWCEGIGLVHDPGPAGRERCVDIFNLCCTKYDLKPTELHQLAELFGGDVVPLSITLHFASPDHYPFVHPYVNHFLCGQHADGMVWDDLTLYVRYVHRMRKLATSIQAAQLVRRVREVKPYATRLQALNLTMMSVGARLHEYT